MILVEEKAAHNIKQNIKRRGYGLGIRLATKSAGCSGLQYIIDYADTQLEDDCTFVSNEVTVFVSNNDLAYLDGSQIVWQQTGLNYGLEIQNPNESARCGCGKSFSI